MTLKQTKKHSFIEANFNTLVGLFVTLFVNTLIFSFTYFQDMSNFYIVCQYTAVMTVVSVARNYFTRRYFDKTGVAHAMEAKLDKLVGVWYSLFTQSKD